MLIFDSKFGLVSELFLQKEVGLQDHLAELRLLTLLHSFRKKVTRFTIRAMGVIIQFGAI